jgi:hypothetical protein
MTDRPAYFCVRRLYGREVPEIYWDYLPRTPLRSLIYIVRLDQLPGADTLTRTPLQQLYTIYQRLKALGKLPPRWEPPAPKKGDPAKPLVGHRESPRDIVQRTRHIDPDDEATDA